MYGSNRFKNNCEVWPGLLGLCRDLRRHPAVKCGAAARQLCKELSRMARVLLRCRQRCVALPRRSSAATACTAHLPGASAGNGGFASGALVCCTTSARLVDNTAQQLLDPTGGPCTCASCGVQQRQHAGSRCHPERWHHLQALLLHLRDLSKENSRLFATLACMPSFLCCTQLPHLRQAYAYASILHTWGMEV